MAAVASPYYIRPMTLDDIPQVSEIERESFPTMWPQTAYKRELQQNSMARYLVLGDSSAPRPDPPAAPPQAPGLLQRLRRAVGGAGSQPASQTGERLAGFIGLWFMLEECHIVTVAVREAMRRRGLGELLVITAVEMALEKEQEVLTLECRVSNLGAQALYEKYGFEKVGLRKRYYTDNNEDALIMTTPHITTPQYRARFDELRAAHRDRWGAAQVSHPELRVTVL